METAPRNSFPAAGLLLGLVGVALVTAVFSRLLAVNSSTVGFFFLLVVLGIATLSGFWISAAVGLVAMLCFNFFFLPPVGMFTIADPENWVALFTFLLTALVASHLSDRAQKRTAEARRHQRETEQLYSLSRAILLTESARPIGAQAAQAIAQIFASPAVMILEAKSGQSFRGGSEEPASWKPYLEEVVRVGDHQRHGPEDLDVWPISLGGSPMGALAAVGIRASDGAVQSMLNLVAIALERVRMQEAANRAEAARQSEEFKSTLLDAIAHEFKTPLTAIQAAATGLRTIDSANVEDRRELMSIVEEEADRLSKLVTEAVKMAEIDAGKVTLHPTLLSSSELLAIARSGFEGRGADRISLENRRNVDLLLDRDLMSLAVRQVLDNALKYSQAGAPVVCSTGSDGDSFTLRIADQGPGIAERDREQTFEKFRRLSGTRDQVAGTGLGLHIAREIARMHGGDLWVEPNSPRGSTFCFRLPRHGGDRT